MPMYSSILPESLPSALWFERIHSRLSVIVLALSSIFALDSFVRDHVVCDSGSSYHATVCGWNMVWVYDRLRFGVFAYVLLLTAVIVWNNISEGTRRSRVLGRMGKVLKDAHALNDKEVEKLFAIYNSSEFQCWLDSEPASKLDWAISNYISFYFFSSVYFIVMVYFIVDSDRMFQCNIEGKPTCVFTIYSQMLTFAAAAGALNFLSMCVCLFGVRMGTQLDFEMKEIPILRVQIWIPVFSNELRKPKGSVEWILFALDHFPSNLDETAVKKALQNGNVRTFEEKIYNSKEYLDEVESKERETDERRDDLREVVKWAEQASGILRSVSRLYIFHKWSIHIDGEHLTREQLRNVENTKPPNGMEQLVDLLDDENDDRGDLRREVIDIFSIGTGSIGDRLKRTYSHWELRIIDSLCICLRKSR